MEYCIVGNSAAAIGAVEGIRGVDKKGTMTIISDEPYSVYSRPLISYYLAGKVSEDKMYYRPPEFYQNMGVELLCGSGAGKLAVREKTVILRDGTKKKYDRLLIATGGKPFVPPIKGLKKQNVHTFHKWDDVKSLAEELSAGCKAVIIGAGLIGVKAAEALLCLGVEVSIIELADRVLSSVLDEQAAAIAQEVMEEHGVKFVFGDTVTEVLGEGRVEGVSLKSGNKMECDMLIVAIGVVPNTDIVKDTGINVNRGIVVNERMETSVEDIYAAGDVAEGKNLLWAEQRVIPILPNAYKQGETAGVNMAGGNKSFSKGLAMNSLGFFDFKMTSAGMQGGEGYEEIYTLKAEDKFYRKLVIKDNRLVGFIALKDIDRTGILTGLIKDQVEITKFKEALLKTEPGFAEWPKELRKERMLS